MPLVSTLWQSSCPSLLHAESINICWLKVLVWLKASPLPLCIYILWKLSQVHIIIAIQNPFLYFLCLYVHLCAIPCLWRSEDNLQELVPSYHVCLRIRLTADIRCRYPLTHLILWTLPLCSRFVYRKKLVSFLVGGKLYAYPRKPSLTNHWEVRSRSIFQFRNVFANSGKMCLLQNIWKRGRFSDLKNKLAPQEM